MYWCESCKGFHPGNDPLNSSAPSQGISPTTNKDLENQILRSDLARVTEDIKSLSEDLGQLLLVVREILKWIEKHDQYLKSSAGGDLPPSTTSN